MYYLFREELANIKKHISGLLPFLKKNPSNCCEGEGQQRQKQGDSL